MFPPLTIPGPLQEYDGLLMGVDAVNVPLVVVHVIVSDEEAVALGAVVLLLTFTVDVPVHPFDGSVTVTVYVPAAFTVGEEDVPPLTIPGPLQEYDGLEIPVLAEMIPEVVVQFNAKGEPPVTLGAVVFELTLTLAVLVHPLAVLVTVTVYVPVAFTVGVAEVPPLTIPGPLQEYVGLPALVLAEIVPEVVVHVSVSDEPGVTVGAVVLEETVMLPVFVQPFAVLVTVTLYVPDAFTVGAADVDPLTMPGPLQE